MDRKTLCNLLLYYFVSSWEIVNIIRNSCDRRHCMILHEGKLTDAFVVGIGVIQDCLFSRFLFRLLVDRIMKTSKWKWTKYTLRESSNCITIQALTWSFEERRKRERPMNTIFRELKAHMKRMNSK